MKTISLDYWTDQMYCEGGNVGGSISVELSEEQASELIGILEATEDGEVSFTSLSDTLSESLFKIILESINEDFKYMMAKDAIDKIGQEAFENITDREYESLSMKEKVDRLIAETDYSDLDFEIKSIELS